MDSSPSFLEERRPKRSSTAFQFINLTPSIPDTTDQTAIFQTPAPLMWCSAEKERKEQLKKQC